MVDMEMREDTNIDQVRFDSDLGKSRGETTLCCGEERTSRRAHPRIDENGVPLGPHEETPKWWPPARIVKQIRIKCPVRIPGLRRNAGEHLGEWSDHTVRVDERDQLVVTDTSSHWSVSLCWWPPTGATRTQPPV
jgi:hypothetical protein